MQGDKSQKRGAPTARRVLTSRLICEALFLCLAATLAVKVKRRDEAPGGRLLKVPSDVTCLHLSWDVPIPAPSCLRAIGPHQDQIRACRTPERVNS